jgi:nucleotide-binding universal stress UspA family protein
MRILALVDSSLYGKSVIDHATWAAASRGATLELLHVISPNELLANRVPVHPGGAMIVAGELTQDRKLAALRLKGGVLLAAARTTLVSRGLTNVRTRIEEGGVLELAAQAAQEADLVIMGKRGEDADLARLHLGANVEPFVRACDVPVLVVSRAYRQVSRCLLAFDLDEASATAVRALAVSKLVPPLPILVLHVGRDDDDLRSHLAAFAGSLQAAGFEVTTEVIDGDPRQVIAERAVADGTDLVIMGAFGRSRLKSLIFGSLTSEILRACQTPVLLAK